MDPVRRFGEIVRQPPAAVRLDEAALMISAASGNEVDVDARLAELDALAASCPDATFDGVLRHLFVASGFRGNHDDYYAIGNSCLDVVLDQRAGIPISLALLAMEIGRRVGVGILGIGMPGHFLVRAANDPDAFADPFGGGRRLDRAMCRSMLERMGAGIEWDDSLLAPVGPHALLARMLANLRVVYGRDRDEHGLRWVARLRVQLPDAGPAEHRELARLLAAYN